MGLNGWNRQPWRLEKLPNWQNWQSLRRNHIVFKHNIIWYFEAMLVYWRVQVDLLQHLFLIINHQKHGGKPRWFSTETTTTWERQGARALDIRESGFALTEHMLDLMKCTSNSRVPLGAQRWKKDMFFSCFSPPNQGWKKKTYLLVLLLLFIIYYLLLCFLVAESKTTQQNNITTSASFRKIDVKGGCLKKGGGNIRIYGSLKEGSISEGEVLPVPCLKRIFHVSSHRTRGSDEPWYSPLPNLDVFRERLRSKTLGRFKLPPWICFKEIGLLATNPSLHRRSVCQLCLLGCPIGS